VRAGAQEDIPISYLRSEMFKVESKQTINCPASNITRTEWTFHGGALYDVPINIGVTDLLVIQVKAR